MPRLLPPSPASLPLLLLLALLLLATTTTQGWSWGGFAAAPRQPATSSPGLGFKASSSSSSSSSSSRWIQQRSQQAKQRRHRGAGSLRCSSSNGIQGWGRVGDRYSWHENEWEVEVTVPVPPGTAKGEVLFEATPTSLSLALASNASAPLMAGAIKGRITMDGTYWSIEGEGEERAVKLLLEKKAGALENAWDWRRVLAEEPATETEYQEPERFDTQAYSKAMLGPDGINMSLVDRDMFGSGGLFQNVTKETLADYVEARVLDDASGLFPKKCKEDEEADGGEGEEE